MMFEGLRGISIAGLKGTLTGRVLANAGWASAATPVTVVLGVVQTGMMARMIGPDGLGALALFTAVCGIFSSFFKLQSAETVMVYVTKALSEDNKSSARHIIWYCYLVDFATGLISFFLVALSSFIFANLLKLPPGSEVLQIIFGLTIIFQSPYWSAHALLRITNRFSWTFYQSVAHSIIKTVLVAFLFFFKAGLSQIVYLLVGLALFDGITLYAFAAISLKQAGISTASPLSGSWRNISADLFRFQILGYGRQVVKSLNRNVDTVVIGHFGNPFQVGLFRSAKQITDQMQVPVQGFMASLFPEYSKLYFSGEKDRLRRLVIRFGSMFLLFGISASIAMWFGAEWIIRIILGESFLPALSTIRILLISEVLILAMSPLYSLPAAAGQAGPALWSVIAAIIVQLCMIAWLVPQHGALGAAWANVFYYVVWSVMLMPSIFKVLRR